MSVTHPAITSPRSRTILKDILTQGLVSIRSGATLGSALEQMHKERISALVCLNRGRPVGILTERGALTALAGAGQDGLKRPLSEIMTSPVCTAGEDTPVHEAFSLLLNKGIRHLVVVDAKDRAVGMVTQTNMVQHLGVEYFVEVKRVGQIMTRALATLSTEANLSETMELMIRGPFSCVVAVSGGKPEGILTERDMVGLLSGRLDLKATLLGQAMSRPVVCVDEDTSVHNAAAMMSRKKIRRLVVVDGAGEVRGLLTQSDIVKGMEARYVEMLREVIREKDEMLREAVGEAARKSIYLDSILNSSMDLGIAASEGNTLAFVNQAARRMLSLPEGEGIGQDLLGLHRALGVTARSFRKILADAKRGKEHSFCIQLGSTKGMRYLEGRVAGIRGGGNQAEGFLLTLQDVTEKRTAEETIRRMAYHDALTGLPNRFLVADRLEQGLAQARRKGCLLAVMLLDLDGFKQINDTLGHNIGDQLLQAVAGRLGALLRKSDTVGRMGGDEFLVILPEVKTPEGAAAVAGKMLGAVFETYAIDGHTLKLSTSIGVAFYPWDGSDATTLIQKADMAMYAAKDAGRNAFRFARSGPDGQPDANPPSP
ncbi:diguanylate cyclase domain-containing protein [Fundidesulfovibrio agrisoli]|uniref:diguanylate cyclase domain-containing protein n=1 Tax=Fundidesulfovibrio agrisoli TaxID=2922717 RepID=UPI001FAC51E0|nr:diguanylate cyclase [Fundidesulfovibrio agrisoli]